MSRNESMRHFFDAIPEDVIRREFGIFLDTINNYHEEDQVVKRMTRFNYYHGPMQYLGEQIVKRMEDAGYPSKIVFGYRSPEVQARLYAKGRTESGSIVTKAMPYESAHQYYEAVDIVHASKGWNVSDAYWCALDASVRIVQDDFAVDLNHGEHWKWRDAAHIELRDWRDFRQRVGKVVPSPEQLRERFFEVLPKVARARVAVLKGRETPLERREEDWVNYAYQRVKAAL